MHSTVRDDRRSSLLRSMAVQILAVLVLTTIVYIPSAFVPWYFDDYYSITDNPNLRSADGIRFILRSYIHRGVVQLTYALDWYLSDSLGLYETVTEGGTPGRQSATIYHISSVLYHLLVVIGVYFLLRKLEDLLDTSSASDEPSVRRETYIPLIAALAFGIHPVHTEAVTYLSGRASVLATLEYVYGILLLLVATEQFGFLDKSIEKKVLGRYVRGLLALLGTLLCFGLGVGTKEIIVTMPAVGLLIVAAIVVQRVSLCATLVRLMPVCGLFAVLTVGFFAYRHVTLGDMVGVPDAESLPWSVNLLSQI